MTFKSWCQWAAFVSVPILLAIFIVFGAMKLDAQTADCINADCNGSGNLDIDDVILYAGYIFGGLVSPCQPCENVLEFGKWYVVEDTVYFRSGMFSVDDSVFSFLDRWIRKDSIYIKNLTNIQVINLEAWLISDTAYLGQIEYYIESPDTNDNGITHRRSLKGLWWWR
jgi:hypothetical protein